MRSASARIQKPAGSPNAGTLAAAGSLVPQCKQNWADASLILLHPAQTLRACGDAACDAAEAPALRALPHPLQNRAPAAFGALQLGQAFSVCVSACILWSDDRELTKSRFRCGK